MKKLDNTASVKYNMDEKSIKNLGRENALKIDRPISNLHTHTVFSDGKGTVRENIEAAIKCGFVSLGISDHSQTSHDDGCMKEGVEREYLAHLDECIREYEGKIRIFRGLELDSESVCNREDYDYIIGSVHALNVCGEYCPVDLSKDAQRQFIDRLFGGDEVEFAKAYFAEVVRHVTDCKPDVVGHFDLITKYDSFDESAPAYRKAALDALHEVMGTCRRFEVNTGAMSRRHKSSAYPADFILREILDCGCTVILSSDSHSPEYIDFAFDETLVRLKKIGFTHLDRLTDDGFISDEI